MAAKHGKIFNAGALQSIIDNTSITFDYDFRGTPSSNWVDVNPVPFFYYGETEETSYMNTSAGGAQSAQPKSATPPSTTNTGSGGATPEGQDQSEGGPHSAEIEALKQYEHSWGTMGSPICSRYKV